MDKNAIKKFAVWARTELIARVSLKGVEYGITEDNIEDANADSVGGKVLTADEKKQRQALIAEINDKGYKQVIEEVAYTWFNRFSALRFMEVNGYLPSHVRVFTDEENNFKPQIITEAIHLDLDGLNMEKVYELKDAEKTEELYKYLLTVQCNALNKILPGMFQKIADYTELLLPDNLLREGSVIQQMIELIPEDDWKDAVQIIGWLYQYYNLELKNQVFSRPKGKKIEKEDIPVFYNTKMGKDFCDSLLSTDVKALSYDLLLRRGTMRINKIHVAFPDPQELREFAAKTAKNENLVVTFPSEYNMEIFPKGCNKDVGIRILAEKYNIAHEDTVAIGDSDNDVAMIEYAHIGIAVANAMEVLKEKADYITKSNDEDGPAIVLKKILKK